MIDPKGGRLEVMNQMPMELVQQLKRTDAYLDSCTGDYYSYNTEQKIWMPLGNTGLHHIQTLETYGSAASYYVQNTKKYKNNMPLGDARLGDHLYKSKLTEQKCCIIKHYMSHWALNSLPSSFMVLNKNQWDPHPINIRDIEEVRKNYTILAESERGPQIIEHRNTIAVQFHIVRRYSETVTVLQNFIKHKILEIQKVDRIHITLEEADLKSRMSMFKFFGQNKNDSKHSMNPMNDEPVAFTKDFKFSGNNYSRRRKFVIVDNNAINKETIRPSTTASSTISRAQSRENFN
eukprot:403333072